MRWIYSIWVTLLATTFQILADEMPARTVDPPEINMIYQYFASSKAPSAAANSGAYLWIPPKTPKIRAVMVGIHNGIPLSMLQNPDIRAICRKHGIAQILFTPNGSEIGPKMLKDLNFDVTDPEKTAVYDSYLGTLARLSGHEELITAPIVPLAHSAYMSFPFDAAMRNPERCLAAIPIKAGCPNQYSFYGVGGKAKVSNPELCLRNVPLLCILSASQETVEWSKYPHGFHPMGFIDAYRRDHNDNPGTAYEPHNELGGASWDMMSGHFDMLPRNYRFVAQWLDAVATARLPETPGQPLKVLALKDGWLMDPQVPTSGVLSQNFPEPARYLDFKGARNKALWFPNESLACDLFGLVKNEPRREIEMFTVLDAQGKPLSLAHGVMAELPQAGRLLQATGDGQFTLTTYHFTAPFDICTVKEKGHTKRPDDKHILGNLLFPDRTSLPLSKLPLHFDANSTPVELVKTEEFTDERGVLETRFIVKLKRNRFWPDCGYQQIYPRIYHEGNETYSAAGRSVKIEWVLQDLPNAATQVVTFPPVPDMPVSTPKIELKAVSSAGLPVDYFVVKGPGIIKEGSFIPAEIPAGLTQPIEVTIGAYQMGLFKESGGVKPTPPQYQTFRMVP